MRPRVRRLPGPPLPRFARRAGSHARSASPHDTEDAFDDVQGTWINYETHPIEPLLVGPLGAYLFALNQPAMRMALFYLPSKLIVSEVPAGPGLVSMAPRENTTELWLVDRVTSAVSVVDVLDEAIVRTIRVGAEPHGLVFHPSGDRAYVACSGANRVDVISTASYSVVNSIPVDVLNPRGIAFLDGRVWVAPLLSGNNTASAEVQTLPFTARVIALTGPEAPPGVEPLPDRDLVCIVPDPLDPTKDAVDPEAEFSGLGTLLTNLHARPGTSELWIPNTEALNAVFRGERNFPAGQVVENRVTIVDVASGEVSVVDLDALAGQGVNCSTPTGVAFDEERGYAFVCGYGSDTVAVLDTSQSPPGWVGTYVVPGADGGPSGPRTCAVDTEHGKLFVYNKGDNSFTEIDLDKPVQWGAVAPAPTPLGYDPTPPAIRAGRFHHISTANSKSGTSSCNSCHFDGHLDGVVWDLSAFSDPEGTPSNALQFEEDRKGPMVTQSLRGLAEMAPYHWRGERATLKDFNPAFTGLLERTRDGELEPLSDAEFAEFERYVFSLVYGPNPRQEVDRGLTEEQTAGFEGFVTSCEPCHTFPLGTNGELQHDAPLFLSKSTQVTHMRGVQDKLGGKRDIGPTIFLGTRSDIGLGLSHSGIIATLDDFLLGFPLPQETRDQIVAYLKVFDAGHAPAAGYQATLCPENFESFEASELSFLESQAAAGYCDVFMHGFYYDPEGEPVNVSAAYDHATGQYQFRSSSVPQAPGSTLVELVKDGAGKATFFGVARGLGWRWGVDRDYDGLLDHDEFPHGTGLAVNDTDGDGFSDGHEVAWGMDPLVPDEASADGEPPAIDGPVQVAFTTTNTAKLVFRTSEPCQVRAAPGGVPGQVPLSPHIGGYDVNHVLVVDLLEAGGATSVELSLQDEGGNTAYDSVSVTTLEPAVPGFIRVESIDVELIDSVAGGSLETQVLIEVQLADHKGGVPVDQDFTVEAFAYYAVDGGPLQLIEQQMFGVTDTDGRAQFTRDLDPIPLGPGDPPPPRRVHAGVRHVESNAEPKEVEVFFTYVEAHDQVNFAVFEF